MSNPTLSSDQQEPESIKPQNESSKSSSEQRQQEQPLINLIGHNLPSLPLQSIKFNPSQPQVRQKPSSSSNSTSAQKWILAPFENPARKDGLKLNHWIRSDEDQEVYRFAKFNTTSNVYSYTTEEYYHLLRDDDWTKEETDYLFNLLNTYDLRFPVVHDRYEFVGSRERTLDDLKARYYSICQTLIQHRPHNHNAGQMDELAKKQLIQSYSFDKHREAERKKHVKALLNRSSQELMEEEFLYIETRRLEQTLLKRIRNRDELLKLIGGFKYQMLNEYKFWPAIEPGSTNQRQHHIPNTPTLSSQPQSKAANRSIHPIHIKKRHHRPSETFEEFPASAGPGEDRREGVAIDPQAQAEHDEKNCIYRFDLNSISSSMSGSAGHHRSVGVRSARITLPKTVAASTRIAAAMEELKIPSFLSYLPKPLLMPTRENVESYERLIQATNQFVDLKRLVDRVESDLRAHRKKKESFLQSASAAHPSSSAHQASGDAGLSSSAEVEHSAQPRAQTPKPETKPTSTIDDNDPEPSNKKRSVSASPSSSSSYSSSSARDPDQKNHPSSRKKVRRN